MYNSVIKILESKDNYYRFLPFIKDHTLSPELNKIIQEMGEYFSANPTVKEIPWSVFITWFKMKNVGLSKEKHSLFDKIFSVVEEDIDDSLILPIIESLVEKDYAVKMSDHLLRIAEGDDTRDILDVEKMLHDFKDESGKVAEVSNNFVDCDIDSLVESSKSDGLEWRLEELNQSVGALRGGDFVIISARPDSGKTTMLASEATYMAEQLPDDKDVIWFNNEERSKKVQMRIFMAALGWTKDDIESNPIGAKTALESMYGRLDKIKQYHNESITVREVEEVLESVNPGLIIFDQLWNVQGLEKSSFSEADKMTRLFTWARGIAKEVCPVVTVHQADATAHGERYIQQNQLYMSKTGIQGAADAIIGIGRTFESGYENMRYLHVSKNKMEPSGRMDSKLRNGKFEVEILPEIARFKGVF